MGGLVRNWSIALVQKVFHVIFFSQALMVCALCRSLHRRVWDSRRQFSPRANVPIAHCIFLPTVAFPFVGYHSGFLETHLRDLRGEVLLVLPVYVRSVTFS